MPKLYLLPFSTKWNIFVTTKAQKDVHHWRLQNETHNIPEQHVYSSHKQNTVSIIPLRCLNFSENKSWQDNFFRIQKTGNAFMFIIYNNDWQLILPFPSFLLSKKCRAKTEYVFCAHIGNKFWFASH